MALWVGAIEYHNPAWFAGHGHFGSRDITFLVVEGQNSTWSCSDPPSLFIPKPDDIKAHDMSY